MKKNLATIYAIFCTLLLAAGFVLCFVFAWKAGTWETAECLLGLVLGFALAPVLHETGHIVFAEAANMQLVYAKFFCLRIYEKEGKKRLGFASPFSPDETQVVPKSGGDMQRRATLYTLGGLIVGGAFLLIILAAAILCTALNATRFTLWGMIPYSAYLCLLNLPPVEYASGKTDTLVWRGIRKGYDGEKTMLAAMEIQGQLFAGKSFSEIDKKWYFDLPQLCEDEPLFAVMLDLKYRYFLEKEELVQAADCLNRLAGSQAYLPDAEVEKLAAELTYMHALRGDLESAEESGKLCKEYLQSETASAKRILLAYAKAAGKTEALAPLKEQAEKCLESEKIAGVRKFEEILLSRIEI